MNVFRLLFKSLYSNFSVTHTSGIKFIICAGDYKLLDVKNKRRHVYPITEVFSN